MTNPPDTEELRINEEAQAKAQHLEMVLRQIAAGDTPRTVGAPDLCIHGTPLWNSCPYCIEEFAWGAVKEQTDD